jgi:Arc/MetJ-type ribon-helix-helix transcriptional regulator
MGTIPVQLPDPDLQKIDLLINLGKYKNRTQAIREIIHSKLTQESLSLDFENAQEIAQEKKIIQEILESGPVELKWKEKRSAAELLRMDRDEI